MQSFHPVFAMQLYVDPLTFATHPPILAPGCVTQPSVPAWASIIKEDKSKEAISPLFRLFVFTKANPHISEIPSTIDIFFILYDFKFILDFFSKVLRENTTFAKH